MFPCAHMLIGSLSVQSLAPVYPVERRSSLPVGSDPTRLSFSFSWLNALSKKAKQWGRGAKQGLPCTNILEEQAAYEWRPAGERLSWIQAGYVLNKACLCLNLSEDSGTHYCLSSVYKLSKPFAFSFQINRLWNKLHHWVCFWLTSHNMHIYWLQICTFLEINYLIAVLSMS